MLVRCFSNAKLVVDPFLSPYIESLEPSVMLRRYSPYGTGAKTNPPPAPLATYLWFGSCSKPNCVKTEQYDASIAVTTKRHLGVFDAVEAIKSEGLTPSSMPMGLGPKIMSELDRRLSINAQAYDQDTEEKLKGAAVRTNTPGGWLRNLVAQSFAETEADSTGSTQIAVAHLTGTKLHYCVLGAAKIFVFRQCRTHGAREVFQSPSIKEGTFPQAYLPDTSWLTYWYIKHVFGPCRFNLFPDVRPDDTILVAGAAVVQNVGDARLAQLIGDAYRNARDDPVDIAQSLVEEACKYVEKYGGDPSDVTCAVGYVCVSPTGGPP